MRDRIKVFDAPEQSPDNPFPFRFEYSIPFLSVFYSISLMDPNLLQFAWFYCKQYRNVKHILQYMNDLYLVDLVCVYEDIAKKRDVQKQNLQH